MASKTASLLIRLTDEVSGPAAKAGSALKGLATAGDGLSRLKSAAAGLDQLGAKMRQARIETEKTAKELAAAEKRVGLFKKWRDSGSHNYDLFKASGEVDAAEARLRAARRAHAAAERQMAATREGFVEQKRTVGALTASLGALGGGMRQVAAAEQGVAAAANAVNAALARQPGLMSTASQKAAGLARTYKDLAAGMAAAGRRQMEALDASRRMIAGMSAPARAAQNGAVARDRAELAATYAAGRRYQTGSMAGGAPHEGAGVVSALAGAGAAQVARQTYEKARDGYLEMDEATRRQQAVLQIDVTKQRPLYEQALRIGQDTRFSNADVVKAQTRIGSSLPDHLKTAGLIRAVTDNAKDYALAMGTTMDEASSAILGRMLAMNYDMTSPDAAAASSRHAANRLVQFAKSSGADHHDIMGYTKFGAAPGQVGGFSEEFADALGAQLRRIGYEGAMAGNFVRAAATKLAVPTDKGRAVMAANDVDHDDYVDPSKRMSAESLDNVVRLKFGKSLTASQSKRIAALMQDEDVVGSREEFVPQVSAILQETLAKRGKKGKVNAQDAAKIAKLVNEYMTATAGATDIERLMRDLIAKGLTPAMAKYLFGQEHGGRAQGLKLDTLNKDQETFRNTPNDRAAKIGADINAGFYGAYQRMIGSIETLSMRLAQVNDGPLTRFYDRVGNAVDAVSNLPDPVIAFGTQVAAATAGLIALKGTLGTLSLLGVTTAATVSRALGRLVPHLAAAEAGRQAGTVLGETINEVGAIAAGKHWTPKDEDDLQEARRIRDEKRAQIDVVRARVHPSRQGEFNPDIDRIEREVQDLDNRIRSGEEAKRAGLKLSDAAREALDARKAGVAPAAPRPVVATPAPPVRPPEFGGVTDAAAKAGAEAGQAIADGIRAQAPEAGRAGTAAGASAGEGVGHGIERQAPQVEDKARTLWERIKAIFAEPIKISLDLDTGGVTAAAARGRATWVSLSGAGGGSGRPGSGRALPVGVGPGIGHTASRTERAAYIREAAARNGIDPEVALRVAQSEGFNSYVGDQGRSFGDWQLFTGGGLGNKALAAGINVRDPGTWRQQTDFALREAAKGGWGPWYGAARVGIGRWQGIGAGKPAPAAPATRPPGLTREDAASALQRVQDRYPPPTAVPGLSRPAPGMTPSGVPAVAPRGDATGLDALGARAGSLRDQLAALSTVAIAPRGDTTGLDGLIAKANAAASALSRVAALAGSANAAIGAVNAAAGAGRGGEAAPASTGMVRRGLANNFA